MGHRGPGLWETQLSLTSGMGKGGEADTTTDHVMVGREIKGVFVPQQPDVGVILVRLVPVSPVVVVMENLGKGGEGITTGPSSF